MCAISWWAVTKSFIDGVAHILILEFSNSFNEKLQLVCNVKQPEIPAVAKVPGRRRTEHHTVSRFLKNGTLPEIQWQRSKVHRNEEIFSQPKHVYWCVTL